VSDPATDEKGVETFRLRLLAPMYETAKDLAHVYDLSLNAFITDAIVTWIRTCEAQPHAKEAVKLMRQARE